MASIRQIEANRRNSQKSTGPRTLEGKAASSMNALKSGIDAESQVIRGEDPNALETLKAGYYESLTPTGPQEAVLVDSIIAADWLLRRLRKAEAETWDEAFQQQEKYERMNNRPAHDYRLATALQDRGDIFHRLHRCLDAVERSLHRSIDALRRLRQDRPNPDPTPPDLQPPVVSPSADSIKAPIGFVPPTLPEPVCEAGFPAPALACVSRRQLNNPLPKLFRR